MNKLFCCLFLPLTAIFVIFSECIEEPYNPTVDYSPQSVNQEVPGTFSRTTTGSNVYGVDENGYPDLDEENYFYDESNTFYNQYDDQYPVEYDEDSLVEDIDENEEIDPNASAYCKYDQYGNLVKEMSASYCKLSETAQEQVSAPIRSARRLIRRFGNTYFYPQPASCSSCRETASPEMCVTRCRNRRPLLQNLLPMVLPSIQPLLPLGSPTISECGPIRSYPTYRYAPPRDVYTRYATRSYYPYAPSYRYPTSRYYRRSYSRPRYYV